MPVLGTIAAASARGFGFSTQNTFGEQSFTNGGTYSFVVPAGVTSISAVAIGGGGGGAMTIRYNVNTDPSSLITAVPIGNPCYAGGGGALAYVNSISVTPGETLTVNVGTAGMATLLSSAGGSGLGTAGGDSYVRRSSTDLVRAGGGAGSATGVGGAVIVGSGGAGGDGGNVAWDTNYGNFVVGGSGGGAGGYSGAGGDGASGTGSGTAGGNGAGGGAGGGGGGGQSEVTTSGGIFYSLLQGGAGGGGVSIYGQGASGAGGTAGVNGSFTSSAPIIGPGGGGGGSGGDNGSPGNSGIGTGAGNGASIGGGGGSGGSRYTDQSGTQFYTSAIGSDGRAGAVRIIWSTNPTVTRAFPSTNVGQL